MEIEPKMMKKFFKDNKKEAQKTAPYSTTIMVREKKNHRLHLIHSIKSNDSRRNKESSELWTEVIGWYAGNDILHFRQTPKC